MSEFEFDSDNSAEDEFEEESSSEEAEYEEGDDLTLNNETFVDCKKTSYINQWTPTSSTTLIAEDFSFVFFDKDRPGFTKPIDAFLSIISPELIDV